MNQYDITFIGCDNIFKNVEELRNLIKLGKTKKKIIKSQIEYLNSDNYCISKHKKNTGKRYSCDYFSRRIYKHGCFFYR